jgi:hypothetical protein
MGDRLGIHDVVDIFKVLFEKATSCCTCKQLLPNIPPVPRGLTARISGFHPGGPGSTPGVGIFCLSLFVFRCRMDISGKSLRREQNFRYRELNPGHLGESQVS